MNASRRSKELTLSINGEKVRVNKGASVAAAMLQSGIACRISVTGEPRAPLCGMGICMECCATVDGVQHARTCQIIAHEGMSVVTA